MFNSKILADGWNYALILILSAVAAVSSLLIPSDYVFVIPWMRGIAVSLFASFITVLFVDRMFQTRERLEQEKIMDTALLELHHALNNHFGLLRTWYRASVADPANSESQDLLEAVENGSIEQVRLLDFNAKFESRDVQLADDTTFLNYSGDRLESFREEIDDILMRYGPHMDADLVDALYRLKESSIITLLPKIANIDREALADNSGEYGRRFIEKPAPFLAFAGYQMFEEHLDALLTLVDYYDDPGGENLSLIDLSGMWEGGKPGPGSARVDLTLDDLNEIENSIDVDGQTDILIPDEFYNRLDNDS